jgi:hypothetical protein
VDGAHQRLHLDAPLGALVQGLHQAGEERVAGDVADHARPGLALHQHLHRPVREAQQLDDRADGPDLVDALLRGLVVGRLALGAEQELPVAPHGLLQGLDGAAAPHEERHHHVREDDDVAQREQGEPPGGALGIAVSRAATVFVPEDSHRLSACARPR